METTLERLERIHKGNLRDLEILKIRRDGIDALIKHTEYNIRKSLEELNAEKNKINGI